MMSMEGRIHLRKEGRRAVPEPIDGFKRVYGFPHSAREAGKLSCLDVAQDVC